MSQGTWSSLAVCVTTAAVACGCSSATAARVVTQIPAPVAVPENAETYELAEGSVEVQADVSAGTSYTLGLDGQP